MILSLSSNYIIFKTKRKINNNQGIFQNAGCDSAVIKSYLQTVRTKLLPQRFFSDSKYIFKITTILTIILKYYFSEY